MDTYSEVKKKMLNAILEIEKKCPEAGKHFRDSFVFDDEKETVGYFPEEKIDWYFGD